MGNRRVKGKTVILSFFYTKFKVYPEGENSPRLRRIQILRYRGKFFYTSFFCIAKFELYRSGQYKNPPIKSGEPPRRFPYPNHTNRTRLLSTDDNLTLRQATKKNKLLKDRQTNRTHSFPKRIIQTKESITKGKQTEHAPFSKTDKQIPRQSTKNSPAHANRPRFRKKDKKQEKTLQIIPCILDVNPTSSKGVGDLNLSQCLMVTEGTK